jgi:RND family efflux transporter MFP subunit
MSPIETRPNPIEAASRPGNGERSASPEARNGRAAGRRLAAGAFVAATIIAGLILGFIPRWRERRETIADMSELAIPTVSVVSPTLEKPGNGLELPAEIRPWREASIYARANGYLKDWVVDIGAHVGSGQLLAEIETPDLDQQLEQAKAQFALARANLHLAETTDARWQQLLKSASVSEQDADEKTAAREAAAASLDADRANMHRLQELVSFQRIVAPFAGIVTARSVDIGDLINTGNGSRELFHVAQVDNLRVYVRVPEPYALDIAPGQTATLTTPASPGRIFAAKVITTSEAISTASRTLLAELEVDNSQNHILPYSFGEISLKVSNSDPVLTLPSNSILFRAEGLQVAVARQDGTVQMRSVKTGRDFGQTIEILGGVTPADRVVVNPTDALVSGARVLVQGVPGVLAAN